MINKYFIQSKCENIEQRENYKIELYDIDDKNDLDNFSKHDFVGTVNFAIHEVVTARDQTLERPIQND